jgi:O-antigen ligase
MPIRKQLVTKNRLKPLTILNIDNTARICVCLGLFFLPISASLGQLIIIGSLLALFGKSFRQYYPWLLKSKIIYFSMGLVGCFLLSTWVNMVHSSQAFHQTFKYASKLLLLPLIFPLFTEAIWRRRLMNCLIVTALTFSTMATLNVLGIISLEAIFHKHPLKVLSPIPWSLFVAFTLFLLTNRILDETKNRLFHISIFAALLLFMFFINLERTGMLITLLLFPIVFIQRTGRKGILWGLILFPLLAGSLYTISPIMQKRMNQAWEEAKQYRQQQIQTFSSIGLRLSFLEESFHLIKQKPWLGHGTGSFHSLFHPKSMSQATYQELHEEVFGDPHNTYAHIGVQLGLLGLFVFLGWLFVQLLETYSLPLAEKRLAQGLIWIFIIGSHFEDGLLRTRICTFYLAVLFALLAAKVLEKTSEEKQSYLPSLS